MFQPRVMLSVFCGHAGDLHSKGKFRVRVVDVENVAALSISVFLKEDMGWGKRSVLQVQSFIYGELGIATRLSVC